MKILIVDDEKPAREFIARCVEKSGHHTVCGKAESAAEALSIMAHDPAELILLDITMPQVDGLQLLAQMHEHYPAAAVVMLTCHEDFNYARIALQNGAMDYILKPEVSPAMIRILLDRISSRLAQQNSVSSNVFFERERFLQELLRADAPEPTLDVLSARGVPLENTCYFALAVESQSGSALKNLGDGKPFLSNVMVFRENSPRFVLLANLDWTLSEQEKQQYLARFADEAGKAAGAPVGISPLYYQLSLLGRAMQDAIKELCNHFYRDASATSAKDELCTIGELRDKAAAALRNNDPEQCHTLLTRIMCSATTQHVDPVYLKKLLSELLREDADTSSSENCGRIGLELRTAHTWQSLSLVLDTHFADGMKCGSARYSKPISHALALLQERYAENITLGDIACAVFLSNEYLSRRFRAEVGETFSEYLLGLRLDKARELLLRTDARVSDICESVGIGNISYFSSSFKRRFQQSPKEIRTRRG